MPWNNTSPCSSAAVALAGIKRPKRSSLGAGGQAIIELKSPIRLVLTRSSCLPPIWGCRLMSPSKYSSVSAKCSRVRIDRRALKSRLLWLPRRVGVSRRGRSRVGRTPGSDLDGAARMAVDVTIETGCAAHRLPGHAVLGLIEPGCRKFGDEQTQTFQLFRCNDAVEQLAEISLRDLIPAGYVPQVGRRGEKERRWQLGEVSVGDIEVHVKAFVLRMLPCPTLREELVADRLQRVRQRPEPERE